MKTTILFISFAMVIATRCVAQGGVDAEYLLRSELNDKSGLNHGRGDFLRVKGRYTFPISVKMNDKKQPTAWSATVSAAYATMNNEGEAAVLNPDEILNASLNISYTRPLSTRWQLITSLGAGVYAAPDEIAWRSLLANGAAIAAYKVSNNLSIGFGLGLTNSYGPPLVMPMGYLKWDFNGDIKINVDVANGFKVRASRMFGKTIGLELTAIEVDGMSAVRRIDSETKIYSTMMMRSTLSSSLRLSKQMRLRFGIGGIWLRSVKVSDRSLKGFFDGFGDDEGKYRFRPSMRLNVGVSYGL